MQKFDVFKLNNNKPMIYSLESAIQKKKKPAKFASFFRKND